MTRNTFIVTALLALVGLVTPASARDADGPPPSLQKGERVALSVTVIEMSNGAPMVDPKLKALARHFKQSFKNYKTFKHVASHAMRLVQGKPAAQSVRGKRLEAEYLGRKDNVMRVQVKFDGARMTMKVRDGGLWFHAGRRGKGGTVTVLALRARRQ